LMALESGRPPQIGLLLGSRRIRLHAGHFVTGQQLVARATPVWGGREGLVAFELSIGPSNRESLCANNGPPIPLPGGPYRSRTPTFIFSTFPAASLAFVRTAALTL
jgi:hypothetical protein